MENPKHGWYSHEDQEIHGLRFKVFYSDNNIALFGIKGEDVKIAKYMERFGVNIADLTDAKMKTEMDTHAPSGTVTCTECGGTGTITIPAFDSTKAKTELDNVFVPAK